MYDNASNTDYIETTPRTKNRNLEFVLKQTVGVRFPGVKTWCKKILHLALFSRFVLKFHLSRTLVWHTHSFEKCTFKAIPPDT